MKQKYFDTEHMTREVESKSQFFLVDQTSDL